MAETLPLFGKSEMTEPEMTGSAVISPCERYRYRLNRRWSTGRVLLWLMLNPSTADATQPDPTMTRVVNFSRDTGYGACIIGNLYAWRSKDPTSLVAAGELAVGPENDEHIRRALAECDAVVCAWGRLAPAGRAGSSCWCARLGPRRRARAAGTPVDQGPAGAPALPTRTTAATASVGAAGVRVTGTERFGYAEPTVQRHTHWRYLTKEHWTALERCCSSTSGRAQVNPEVAQPLLDLGWIREHGYGYAPTRRGHDAHEAGAPELEPGLYEPGVVLITDTGPLSASYRAQRPSSLPWVTMLVEDAVRWAWPFVVLAAALWLLAA